MNLKRASWTFPSGPGRRSSGVSGNNWRPLKKQRVYGNTIADLAGVPETDAEDSISFRSLLSRGGTTRTLVYSDMEPSPSIPATSKGGWAVSDGLYHFMLLQDRDRLLFDPFVLLAHQRPDKPKFQLAIFWG